MNILHISRTMGQGGAEKVVYQICKESNSDNKMFIASTGGVLEKKLKECDVQHITIPDIDNKNPIDILKTYFILKKVIKKYNIDIIHSHHRMAAFYSRLLCLFNKKVKRIYTAHNVFFNKVKLLRFSLKGSKIVAVGDGVRENLVSVYNIDKKDIDVIYNSIERPDNISIPADEFIKNKGNKIFIGSIGRLNEQKGMDIFISAISEVIKNNKNVYGIIIGDGELKEELINLAKNLNVEDNIIFLGYRSDVFDLIECMDFIVLSSRWEGFPLTPIEVFSMKKTIVASNIDGNNEIVKHELNGLLFEKDNIDDLKDKIFSLINNKTKLKKLEKEAFKDYNDKYSYSNFLDNYINLYKNMGDRFKR